MTIEDWNKLDKPDNVNAVAEEGDIVEEVHGVLLLLQTRNGYNNVIALRVKPDNHFVIWTLFEYCMLLHDKYGIKFIRIEGDKGKYKFLERFFNRKCVVRDPSEKERDLYYWNLEASYETLELKCQEFEFYYTQNLYIKSDNEALKKKYFDKMFFMVQRAVEAALKTRLGKLARKGLIRPNSSEDLYDFTISATANIMSRYKKPKGYKILYLLTTADYAALGILHNPRQQFWDKQISLESWEQYEYGEE